MAFEERKLNDQLRVEPSYELKMREKKGTNVSDGSRGRTESVGEKLRSISDAYEYVEKHRFGDARRDDSDEDEPDPKYAEFTPMTKRKTKNKDETQKIKKLGTWATAFTIFKGFVATGILYTPDNFVNGGWAFSAGMLVVACVWTLYCAHLLLEVYHDLGGGSFPEIGFKCYGKTGKFLTDISLFFSQFGFVCAYIYFIGSELQSVIKCASSPVLRTSACDGGVEINKWWFLPFCMCIYVPLVMVRKLEAFAKFHVFSDVMIAVALVAIITYASIHVKDQGGFTNQGFVAFNTALWPDAIGFSIYSFEGIGVILPILEVTEDRDAYYKILCTVVGGICVMYIVFSEYVLFAYGGYTVDNPGGISQPLIIDSLPPQQVLVWIIKVLFILNLVFSYPLTLYPANNVLESYLFGDWPKSKKRMWCKNLTRTITVFFTCFVGIYVWDNLDKLLSVIGALTCTPIAFTLPALFHYKASAKTRMQKNIDLILITLSVIIMVFCTAYTFITWNA